MNVPFWKMSGAGNDFVLLSGAPRGFAGPALARRLCDRRRGVGADGLLIVARRPKSVRVDYWNADGSAAFCGNGARCAALWAASRGWAKERRFALDTNRGLLGVRLTGKHRADVAMPEPKNMRLGLELTARGKTWAAHFVNAGVPHAVVFVADVEKTDVRALGRELRFHKAFGRAGANVDFVQFHGSTIRLRTYERGVEDETLACGTGVVAAAAVARALGKVRDSAKVSVRSGDVLKVTFGGGVRLEGPGETVFSGEVAL
jgi:diaminopimelate epimerase